MRRVLRTSGTILSNAMSESQGFQRRRQRAEIENLLEQIMKENFPNMVKETHFQEVQEAQRVPNKLDPKKNTPRHIIIKLPKIKGKERILKAAREKARVTKECP